MAQFREDGLLKTETFMKRLDIPERTFKAMIYYRHINGLIECGAVVPVEMANNDLLIDEEKFRTWLKDTEKTTSKR
ncbi:MAG: hypothetical protein J5J00_15300 [Deltaproteobacteria bacterium]|nr:hypothetical protein [Deltaproteobacteria bacterium]